MSEQNTTAVSIPNSPSINSSSSITTENGSAPAEPVRVSNDGASSKPTPAPAPAARKPSKLSEDKRFKIFSGSANRALSEEICKFLGVPLGEAKFQRFSDGEIHFQLLENVRGADVFLIQPTCYPTDQHLMELLIMEDALRRASAGRITAVVPYYGYARQDRKDRPRVAITSQACRRPSRHRRRQSRSLRRPPRRADPGLLQHPRRPPLRFARPRQLLRRAQSSQPHRRQP